MMAPAASLRALSFALLLAIGASARADIPGAEFTAPPPANPTDAPPANSTDAGLPDSTPPPAPAPPAPADAPVIARTNLDLAAAGSVTPLLVFKGATLLNEFVYRAILKLPEGATATPQTARMVVAQLAAFLAEAGYDLAKVRAQVSGARILVQIDEGALDKVIVSGGGWITALRFRAALNLPLDIFNRRLFESQLPHLAKQFGFRSYRYELWPVHLLDADNASALDNIEELRAMPLLHAARGYELRIFGQTEQWSSGFSPEVVLNGPIGIGVGGRYRWKDIIDDGDRWQVHFRFGGALRGNLNPNGGTDLVNSDDYLSVRWLSRPWGGSSSGLRMTIAPHVDFWELQRPDLMLESYRIGTLEVGAGAGAQLSREFSLYFTLGVQRRWIFDINPVLGTTPSADVTDVPGVSNRGFLRATSQYTFNPNELRQDMRDWLSLDLNAYQPTIAHTQGYFHFDLQGHKLINFGWNELRLGLRVTGEAGDVLYIEQDPALRSPARWVRVGEIYPTPQQPQLRVPLLRAARQGEDRPLQRRRRLAPPPTRRPRPERGAGRLQRRRPLPLRLRRAPGRRLLWHRLVDDGYNEPGFSLAIKEAF